jgi:serine/threonine-protein kinase RsbW
MSVGATRGEPGPQRLTFDSDPARLGSMRTWLREALSARGVPAREQSGLVVAVAELCTNAIRHAYEGATGQPITVSVSAGEDPLVIEVEDFGKPFDEHAYSVPDLDALPEHGLGLYLVRQLVDQLSFDVERERGTRWTLVKHRPGR